MTGAALWAARAYLPCAGCAHTRVRHHNRPAPGCSHVYVISASTPTGELETVTKVCDCRGFQANDQRSN